MRERSHEKGRLFQRASKRWLLCRPLLAHSAEEFGDAYDVTSKATSIGDEAFDFSLKLGKGDGASKILYAECKYRDEKKGRIDAEFCQYLCSVCRALKNADGDEVTAAEFLFVANVPPTNWLKFVHDRQKFLTALLKKQNCKIDTKTCVSACTKSHVLVISEAILGES